MILPKDLSLGLLVYLKSGSPLMTVRGIGTPIEGSNSPIGLVQCVWMVDGDVQTADFPAGCLTVTFPGHDPIAEPLSGGGGSCV